ncbi:MAG: tetratricopeptide repeat protein [Bacteroidota bacterium]
MNQPQEYIDAYLRGELSPEQVQEFEQEMKTNKELAQALNERQKLMNVIDLLGDQQLQRRVGQIAKEYHEKGQTKPTRLRIMRSAWWVAAAGIALLVCAYFLLNRTPPTPQELYAANFSLYPIEIGTRSELNDTMRLELEAEKRYNSGAFAEVLPLLDSAAILTADTKWQLAKGICQMELGDHQAAVRSLQVLITEQDILYEMPARWYTALSYLKLGDLDQAQAQLEVLASNSGGFRQSEAVELIEAVKQNR